MCTRYTLHQTDEAMVVIARALTRKLVLPAEFKPRFNVTLTHVMPVVATGAEGPEVQGMMWGLVPFYERSKLQRRMLPNAKAETALTLAAFKQSVAQRRCLVPANGFYEWQTRGKLKLPHLFALKDGEPFAFAGIWEPAEDSTPATFGILTTEPNALVAPIHNRMPVILTEETMSRWLGAEPLPESEYRELTRPLPRLERRHGRRDHARVPGQARPPFRRRLDQPPAGSFQLPQLPAPRPQGHLPPAGRVRAGHLVSRALELCWLAPCQRVR